MSDVARTVFQFLSFLSLTSGLVLLFIHGSLNHEIGFTLMGLFILFAFLGYSPTFIE